MIPFSVEVGAAALVILSIIGYVFAAFRRESLLRLFPKLSITKRTQFADAEGETRYEIVEQELSRLGRILTSHRTWASVALLESILISLLALFYLSSVVISWRISRSFRNSEIARSFAVETSRKYVILTGSVQTEDQFIEASRTADEIAGPAKVINRMLVRLPWSLGDASDPLGSAQFVVDTLYDDSAGSLQQVAAILNLPEVETATLKRDVTLPGFILSRYRIQRAKLPRSYQLVSEKIEALNHPRSLGDLKRGTLILPILPPRFAGATRSNRERWSFKVFEASGVRDSSLNVAERTTVRATASRYVVLQIPFTRGTAAATQANAPEILQSTMTVQFSSSGSEGKKHVALDSDDRKAVLDALGRQSRRRATVFILDSGWPDQTSYLDSIADLRRLVDTAVGFYNLAKVQWTDTPYAPLPTDPKSQHCVYIKDSLREFTDADTRHLVNVVYVPLDTKQGATQLVHELLRLYRIRTLMLGDRTGVDDSTKKDADDYATQTLNSITSSEPFDLESPGSGVPQSMYRQRWRTNSAIIAAVWYLAELAAEQDPQRPVFFLNESWSVLRDKVELAAPESSAGIVVAAAGNTPGKEVNSDTGWSDFAHSATPARNVLAVLDTKPNLNQRFCDSSQLVEKTLNFTMAASFDGEVVDGGLCGTSFSAPRIAFLLALSEATRTEDFQRSEWAGRLQEKLLRLRKPSSSMFENLYLHPRDLFNPKAVNY